MGLVIRCCDQFGAAGRQVRQLRHYFGPCFTHSSALYHTTCAVWYVLRRALASRMLIRACDPMLCPNWGGRPGHLRRRRPPLLTRAGRGHDTEDRQAPRGEAFWLGVQKGVGLLYATSLGFLTAAPTSTHPHPHSDIHTTHTRIHMRAPCAVIISISKPGQYFQSHVG